MPLYSPVEASGEDGDPPAEVVAALEPATQRELDHRNDGHEEHEPDDAEDQPARERAGLGPECLRLAAHRCHFADRFMSSE